MPPLKETVAAKRRLFWNAPPVADGARLDLRCFLFLPPHKPSDVNEHLWYKKGMPISLHSPCGSLHRSKPPADRSGGQGGSFGGCFAGSSRRRRPRCWKRCRARRLRCRRRVWWLEVLPRCRQDLIRDDTSPLWEASPKLICRRARMRDLRRRLQAKRPQHPRRESPAWPSLKPLLAKACAHALPRRMVSIASHRAASTCLRTLPSFSPAHRARKAAAWARRLKEAKTCVSSGCKSHVIRAGTTIGQMPSPAHAANAFHFR